ncbi:MAG TPA: sulfotransferase [Acidimicrobiales bacterium]|nr:sulfotransferase [Acidimicrobiales bacterium]
MNRTTTPPDAVSRRLHLGTAGRARATELRQALRRAQAINRRGVEQKLVWMMGSPRSGSTWLMYLLQEPSRIAVLQEPLIGTHLGMFASYIVENGQRGLAAGVRMRDICDDDRYFFSDRNTSAWESPLRALILRGLAPNVPLRARYVVVQEPNGSEGADLLMRVLKKSRLLFLLRDGRDVVDSVLDAYQPGSWLDQQFGIGHDLEGLGRRRLIEREAQRWVARTEIVARAYDRHPPTRRLLVRYEDLLSDTPKNLLAVYSWLQLDPPADLQERVKARSFDSAPTSSKGSGQFRRAATPGLWRKNLSPEEQSWCMEIMGATLTAQGYAA